MTAEEFYRKGNEYRRKGDWKHAIDCYLEAVERDPGSPAAEAKKMLDDILNYYNKDAYNP
ncbi:tetratricopeptide repeat protein [Prevotella sp. oral taxon 376]|uniref:tetratricopeptide repeat protein n=1 Tax=Prevotella sp. oral taxon 376 TaxID=712466 RepID=UPI000D1F223C|nr:tetratricopeptide repeat protein [Prevotella sp. oral taxon 376]PTL32873.1 tetratricopeptide repeat protein [Prevotella sp. oral taxon 376]